LRTLLACLILDPPQQRYSSARPCPSSQSSPR
jgi:hypothetical protein